MQEQGALCPVRRFLLGAERQEVHFLSRYGHGVRCFHLHAAARFQKGADSAHDQPAPRKVGQAVAQVEWVGRVQISGC
ncbi:hypothetical protein APE01nite_15720 [Acetobacter peroxydans]|uniref:Uncharacterized protein n=1 Tax=Acetobacter peroxydans TaxID=104098 RepID=A0A4Y3TYH5_9PROT|nr:hypothetical protein APE01nite_15720 [Acetobacter peroxydans]